MKNMWMVRAGRGAFLIDYFESMKIVAIGWGLGDLKNKSSEDIKLLMEQKYPNNSKSSNGLNSSQVIKFIYSIKKGDYVVSYNPSIRKYLIGEIISDYYFSSKLDEYGEEYEEYNDTRDVEWLGEVPRDKLKVSTRNTLGSISTLFNINEDAKEDILSVFENKKRKEKDNIYDEEEIDDVSILKDDIIEKSIEFIKDRVNELGWNEMQELVAGLLRAMGYKTIVSPPGSDLGKDIIASPDGLGLEDPVIVVEVKHHSSPISSSSIRSFKGALKKINRGIYLSTGGFTKDAKYEAERSEIPIILMDLDRFVKFIIQYYDNFDNDARALVPLTKIYWPL